ncbi:MAG: ornithine carbamoyltransferase [Deltaproteobacteria bacterium]|nr:ornithine carbamoyltransferase [Deltaproteobacteria bacterium]
MKKDLLNISDLERNDIGVIIEKSCWLKQLLKDGQSYTPLKGKTLGMIFDKSSTRTRISFEVGMFQMGGKALYLNSRDTQIGRGEDIGDTARIMSRYLNGIMIRTYEQSLVEALAGEATIPVINGLTDLLHPCQILSDLFTISEKRGSLEGMRLAYVGDGNNVANSWIEAAAKLRFHLALACPEGYDPDGTILRKGKDEAGDMIALYRDPYEAVREANVVYTDVWASMGQEHELKERIEIFSAFQVNEDLLAVAAKDVMVMHCLPAHRGEEISAEVIDGPRSVVIDQAENRLHVQKAIMEILM